MKLVLLLTLASLTAQAGVNCLGDRAEQFPAIVRVTNRQKPENNCSGAVFNARFVLTAAHCLYYGPEKRKKLSVAADVQVFHGFLGAIPMPRVEAVHVFPGYDATKIETDVAVIALKAAVEDPGLRLATDMPKVGDEISVGGYGVTSPLGKKTDGLRRVGDNHVGRMDAKSICTVKVTWDREKKKIPAGTGCMPDMQDSGSPLIFGNAIAGVFSRSELTILPSKLVEEEGCYVNLSAPAVQKFLAGFTSTSPR